MRCGAMDRWMLFLALVLAAVAAVQGAGYLRLGTRSKWTLPLMIGSFIAQMFVLGARGDMRGACPLLDTGEILVFSAWALTIFYMGVGSMFRLSLLGVFTSPLVAFLLALALVPGLMDTEPVRATSVDPWREMHAALSVMAYGALGLAAVAGVMFIVLNRKLKDADTSTGLFKNLPPARELSGIVVRLLLIGYALLTGGLVCGVLMEGAMSAANHLIAALIIWAAYGILLLVDWRRGMPPGKLSLAALVLFVLSLLVFPMIS